MAATTTLLYLFSPNQIIEEDANTIKKIEFIVKNAQLIGRNKDGNFSYKIFSKKAKANDLNNQIEEAKLLYKNEKFKRLSEVEKELEELSVKREAAQEIFETEQFNRLLTEEVQAEQDFERQVKLEQYLARLKTAYINNIAAKVRSLWLYQGAEDNWTAEVYVLQDRDGNVLAVDVMKNNVGNSAKAKVFMDSIERAIYKSSPLPKAPDDEIFTQEITFKFGVN